MAVFLEMFSSPVIVTHYTASSRASVTKSLSHYYYSSSAAIILVQGQEANHFQIPIPLPISRYGNVVHIQSWRFVLVGPRVVSGRGES